eukprot:4423539-Prymnesium_polylepis.1
MALLALNRPSVRSGEKLVKNGARWPFSGVPVHGPPAYYKCYAGGRKFPGRQVTRPPRSAATAWGHGATRDMK